MSSSTVSTSVSLPLSLSQRLAAASLSVVFGAALIFFAGFSHVEAVHNAAHDTRHSSAFPCH